MKLLHTSIKHDGYTQPVDGTGRKRNHLGLPPLLHRKNHKDIRDSTNGVPIVAREGHE